METKSEPFSLMEQRLLLTPIRELKQKFRGKKWRQVAKAHPHLAQLPGIRQRLGLKR